MVPDPPVTSHPSCQIQSESRCYPPVGGREINVTQDSLLVKDFLCNLGSYHVAQDLYVKLGYFEKKISLKFDLIYIVSQKLQVNSQRHNILKLSSTNYCFQTQVRLQLSRFVFVDVSVSTLQLESNSCPVKFCKNICNFVYMSQFSSEFLPIIIALVLFLKFRLFAGYSTSSSVI